MTPILHLTHVANLRTILATGCLWSPSQMPQGAQAASIAHGHIQSRRANQERFEARPLTELSRLRHGLVAGLRTAG